MAHSSHNLSPSLLPLNPPLTIPPPGPSEGGIRALVLSVVNEILGPDSAVAGADFDAPLMASGGNEARAHNGGGQLYSGIDSYHVEALSYGLWSHFIYD